MKRALFLLSFLASFAFALKSEWVGKIEDTNVELSDGDKETVILKKDPTALGNDFKNEADFECTTTSGSSTLTLQKDPNLNTDMSYFIQGDIRVSGNSHLIMNLNSTGGYGLFQLNGGITADGSTIEINNVNTFVVDAMLGNGIQVTNGGTLNINNVDSLINVSSTSASASIYNNNSTLYIDADVYNYDKDTSTGGGYLLQTGENAETTIEGSFYNAGFKSGSGGRQDALVHINGGTFTVNGNFENGKNDTYASSDYYGVGNVKADNGALITVNGNFISDAQGDSSNGLVRYSSTVDLNNAKW